MIIESVCGITTVYYKDKMYRYAVNTATNEIINGINSNKSYLGKLLITGTSSIIVNYLMNNPLNIGTCIIINLLFPNNDNVKNIIAGYGTGGLTGVVKQYIVYYSIKGIKKIKGIFWKNNPENNNIIFYTDNDFIIVEENI